MKYFMLKIPMSLRLEAKENTDLPVLINILNLDVICMPHLSQTSFQCCFHSFPKEEITNIF